MVTQSTIPQFHLYGENVDDKAFNLIHIESIRDRSRPLKWTIAPHSHRYLHQVMVVRYGQGVMSVEDRDMPFEGPCLMFLTPTIVHGFQFDPTIEGYVLTFSEDVARSLFGEQTAKNWLDALETSLQIHMSDDDDMARIYDLVEDIYDEMSMAREGHRVAMRALLMLFIVSVARRARSRMQFNKVMLRRVDSTVKRLRDQIEERFRSTRKVGDYAAVLNMTADRLNEHCKKVAGVTAGHLIRQRVITEAKRQLIFTDLAITEIAYDLNFSDPSHFSRFFRRYTEFTPQQFRDHNASS
ncbi:MAG: hypothetical protein COB90_07255 [Hyphomicrobiales bacterium]|nr:helix-turn-helix domain-containing protein [Cohaesibacteraceae bacterium]PCH80761.1 MAG: hypothetical protein COB90_07255 [Hyphomicrobiales bacterium]